MLKILKDMGNMMIKIIKLVKRWMLILIRIKIKNYLG